MLQTPFFVMLIDWSLQIDLYKLDATLEKVGG
jgi:hypothetical protein